MTLIPIDSECDRLDAMIEAGDVIRGKWIDENPPDGKARACLLSAAFPECGEAESATACPAKKLWPWLANLAPFIDDRGTIEKWPGFIRRFAAIIRRLHLLDEADPTAQARLDFTARKIAVVEARRHVSRAKKATLAAIDRVIKLLDRAIRGDVPTDDEWALARARAMMVEAWAVAAAAAVTVAAAVTAADWAVAAAAAAVAAGAAVAAAKEAEADLEAAADRIIDAVLSAIEGELAKL